MRIYTDFNSHIIMKSTLNIFLSVCFLSLISTVVFSQNDFKVGLYMGSVQSLGEYKSINNDDLNAGFAQSGFCLNFDGDYFISHRFAFSARFHFSLSAFNDAEVAKWLKQEVDEYFIDDTLALKSIGYWQWSSPLIGFKYNYPIVINKLYVEAGLFSGLSIIPTPIQSLKIDDIYEKREIYSENISKTDLAVPIMFDIGLRARFNENIQLKIQTSYYYSKTSYQHINYIVNESSPLKPETLSIHDIDVPLKTLSISMGIIYTL